MKRVLLLVILLMGICGICYAEPTKVYPGIPHQWTWDNYNIPYVLSEYDKIASKPGCKDWLDKTGFSRTINGTHEYHELPGYWVFISGAKSAGWVVEGDYTKPVPGAIAYHDANAGMPGYSFSLKFIRNVQDDVVTVEAMNDNGKVVQWKVPIAKMQFWGKNMFKGYIYPWKVGEEPHSRK